MVRGLASTPTGLRQNIGSKAAETQPRWGWQAFCERPPRVVPPTGQPWAGGHNPFGIEASPCAALERLPKGIINSRKILVAGKPEALRCQSGTLKAGHKTRGSQNARKSSVGAKYL